MDRRDHANNGTDRLALEDQMIAAMRRITRATDLHSRSLIQQHGLTAPQLAALQAAGHLQPISAGALARAIHLSQATITGIVARLEARGLIARCRSGNDRRSVMITVTEQGSAVLRETPSLLQSRFRCQLDNLPQWEQTQILATLQRVATMMDAGREAAEDSEHGGCGKRRQGHGIRPDGRQRYG